MQALKASDARDDARASAPMSLRALKEAERTRASHRRRERPMGLGVRRGELLLSGGFLIGAFALPVLGGVNQTVSAGTIALYVIGTAAATCVRFDVGAGFTVPTQAIFVPMLFAVP